MKRILFVSLSLILIVSLFVFPALGATNIDVIDYNNYITDVWVQDGEETINVAFPDTGVWFTSGADSPITSGTFSYMTTSNVNRSIYYDPFRDVHNNILTFRRSDFPTDTVFTFAFSCDTENVPKAGYMWFTQWDKDGNNLGTVKSSLTLELMIDKEWDTYVTVKNQSLSFVPNCYSFSFMYEFVSSGVPSTTPAGSTVYWYNYRYRDFACQFTIDSIVRQQQLSQTTNSLLTAVEDKLAENGEKLDTIINGDVTPTPPAGGDSVGDLEDVESGLREDSQAGLDDSIAMQQSALQIFQQYSVAFLVVADLFTSFANIPFFSFLLYISVALGIFSLLVNLGVDVSLASDKAKKRDQKHQQRQMIKKSRGK